MRNEIMCPFDIWAPGNRSAIENTAFSAYAMHQERLDDIIDEVVEFHGPEKPSKRSIWNIIGIEIDSLTTSEVDYIIAEVRRRR